MGPDRTMTVISAERVYLVPPAESDFREWALLRASSRDYLEPWEPLWPEDALTRQSWKRRIRIWRSAWKTRAAYVFLIRRVTDDTLLGGISLSHVRPWPAETATLGYWIGQGFSGQGYMREAVRTLCDWAFRAASLSRIEAGIVPENQRSRGVLEATGFREEGRAASYLEIAGVRRDHILFGLVKSPPRA